MAANRQRPKKKPFPKKNKSRVRRLTAGIFRILLGLVILSFLLVLILRWINPPTSMMMAIRRGEAEMNHRKDFRIDYRWVDWDQIALHLPLFYHIPSKGGSSCSESPFLLDNNSNDAEL